jgi:hypothetical protein
MALTVTGRGAGGLVSTAFMPPVVRRVAAGVIPCVVMAGTRAGQPVTGARPT